MYINEAKEVMKAAIMDQMPVAFWGPSGIGKSAIALEAASDLSEESGTEFEFIDIRLSTYEPSDLRGVLVPDMKAKKGVWLPPSVLPTDPDFVGVIMFDEISSAVPLVQAAAYQLFLDRKIGEYTLPEGASLLAAGNRLGDKGVVFPMAAPLANRFGGHIEVELSVEQWKWWAYREGIDQQIIGFISANEDKLHHFNPQSKEKAFASPRSWSFVDQILNCKVSKEHIMQEWVESTISKGIGSEFWAYRSLLNGVVSTEDLLDMNKEYDMPRGENEVGIIHGINASLVHNLKRKMTDRANDKKKGHPLTEDEVNALFRYFNRIEREEMRVATYKEMTSNKIPIVGSPYKSSKDAFDKFFETIRHLVVSEN
jgi:hypothetical protein